VLVVVSGLVVAGCGVGSESSPTTARVVLGSVSRSVSATGTLQAISQQHLGFAEGGQLTEVLVSVGQQVAAGQALARIDDFAARTAFARAQARLSGEQARLDRLADGKLVDAARDDFERSRDVAEATRDEADAIDDANADLIGQLQHQLSADRQRLAESRRVAVADQARCNRSVTGGSGRYDGYGDYADTQTRDRRGLLFESPLNLHSPSCDRSGRGKAAVSYYERRIDEDQAALASARRRDDVQHAQRRVARAQALRDVTAARNAAEAAEVDRPHLLDEQAAQVAEAAAAVSVARRAIADTVLYAPTAGTVASINGAVGEYVGSGSGTTPLAPGGRVALPDLESGVGNKDHGNDGGQRPDPGSFITLKDVHSFQVVAPFAEADAAQLAVNQKVQVNFDAVPGLTKTGVLTALAPTGTQINDVTNYYATIVLTDADPRLRTGQTAQTNVIVGGVDNVLVVPTAAIQRAGNTGIVTLLQPDGTTRRVQVELGLVGDQTTQILSGLKLGQQVVMSS
jgi:HlyD family secretion protein